MLISLILTFLSCCALMIVREFIRYQKKELQIVTYLIVVFISLLCYLFYVDIRQFFSILFQVFYGAFSSIFILYALKVI